MGCFSVYVTVSLVLLCSLISLVSGIGANWGTQATHPLPPDTVVNLLKDNGIRKVKLFDAEYGTLKALGGSNIEVMVGIPNDMLASLAGSMKAAEKWVSSNVSKHISSNNVNIRCASLCIYLFIYFSIQLWLKRINFTFPVNWKNELGYIFWL